MGWGPHQGLWWDLQARPFDLGVLHLCRAAGLLQVYVLITDVLLLSSAMEKTPDLEEMVKFCSICDIFSIKEKAIFSKETATLHVVDFCRIINEDMILNRKSKSAHSCDLRPCK